MLRLTQTDAIISRVIHIVFQRYVDAVSKFAESGRRLVL